jgi:hypothetical protein
MCILLLEQVPTPAPGASPPTATQTYQKKPDAQVGDLTIRLAADAIYKSQMP